MHTEDAFTLIHVICNLYLISLYEHSRVPQLSTNLDAALPGHCDAFDGSHPCPDARIRVFLGIQAIPTETSVICALRSPCDWRKTSVTVEM